MGILLLVIGLIFSVIGGLWMILEAFKESVLWGIGCIFIPVVGLVFAILHWEKAKQPFMWMVLGWVLIFIGGVMQQSRRERIGGSLPAKIVSFRA